MEQTNPKRKREDIIPTFFVDQVLTSISGFIRRQTIIQSKIENNKNLKKDKTETQLHSSLNPSQACLW